MQYYAKWQNNSLQIFGDDWSVDESAFNYFNQNYGPFSIDVFADSSNKRCLRFLSNFLCPGSSGINAFAHSWSNENIWACPPVKFVLKTIEKIENSDCSGVLIVPEWKTSIFWPRIFSENCKLNSRFKDIIPFHPFIIQNQRARSPMLGKTPFRFLGLIF